MDQRFIWARWLYLRGLGLAALIAFLSAWGQLDGLLGASGILPAQEYLQYLRNNWSTNYIWRAPTLFWWGGDAALHAGCALGASCSLALILGWAPRWALFGIWSAYLSLCTVGRTFFAFQWDILLTELALAGIWLAPPGLRPGLGPPLPLGAFWLHRLIFFKLMFSSGWVKWASGDQTWRNLSALRFHYWTQPLPTWPAWYAHQLPQVVHTISVAMVFAIQLGASILVLGPTRARRWGVSLLLAHQLLIALTGNYGFFNLLAVSLGCLLLDDACWAKLWPRGLLGPLAQPVASSRRGWGRLTVIPLLVLQVLVLAGTVFEPPEWLQALHAPLGPFRSVNSYGLFANMTTERLEIVLEGSRDGQTWHAYQLPWQPQEVSTAPQFVAPHQPRLDWQLWFAALGSYRQNPWFTALMSRLLTASPAVLDLFAHDPFGGEPPVYVRARTFRFRFTTWAERRATGAWWVKTASEDYFPAISLSGRLHAP